jgi:hypothetical protein
VLNAAFARDVLACCDCWSEWVCCSRWTAGAFLHQILGTRLFLFGEFQLGFGLIELGLRLVDLLMLAVDLGLDVVNIGLSDRYLYLGLVDCDDIIAIVDPGEQVAGLDVLVVGNRHFPDITGDLRCNGEAPRGDKGVIGGFIIADAEPIDSAAEQDSQQNAGRDRGQKPMLAKAGEQGGRRLILLLGSVLRRAILGRRQLRRFRGWQARSLGGGTPLSRLGVQCDTPVCACLR